MKQYIKIVIFAVLALCLILYCVFVFIKGDFSLEDIIRTFWENHVHDLGYFILFFWSILEGESGLVLAGVAVHDGKMIYTLALFVAGLGGFVGDQIYFYIGRYNKKYIQKKLKSQRRKFAVAHLLLKKYGWPIIFIQRYMYGFRTIIPMSIGITRYDAKKFALINLISAFIWAGLTITLAWYFGKVILEALSLVKQYWYFAIFIVGGLLFAIIFAFRKMEKNLLKKRSKNENRI